MVEQVVVPDVYSLNSSFMGDIALVELTEAANATVATLPSPPVVEPAFAIPPASTPSPGPAPLGLSMTPASKGEPLVVATNDAANTTSSIDTVVPTEATSGSALPLTAIGWGFTSDVSVLSTSLMEALLTRLSDEECEAFHAAKGLGEKPVDHFCAGDATGADTCRGDSGGPLLEGDSEVVGITSYGASDSKCGSTEGNSTGVYTSSEYWSPWIVDSIALFNMGGESKPSRQVNPDFFTCWEDDDEHQVTSRQIAAGVGECAEMCRADVRCMSFQWEFATGQCSLSLTPDIATVDGKGLCHTGRYVSHSLSHGGWFFSHSPRARPSQLEHRS